MNILLLGATEGLRFQLSALLASALPGTTIESRELSAVPLTEIAAGRYRAAIIAVGRQGEHLATLRQFLALCDRGGLSLPPLALTTELESELSGRALIAGATQALPLRGLQPESLADALKMVIADAARSRAGRSTRLPIVPGYRILRQIGEGGMSKVYLAQKGADERAQVLKVVDAKLAEDEEFVQRFARECRLLSRIRHENVVELYDYSTEGSRPYLAMQYFAGGDLKQRMRGGIPAKTALRIMMQIAKAVDAVHTAGLVHRDLKPHNIMFRDLDNLSLVDFGLAKPIDPSITSEMQLTQDGMILATPLYMSPEQCKGIQPDARADIYSCGVILYELLAGETPFRADNPGEIAFMHVSSPVPQLPTRFAGFQPVVEKLMAKEPNERFQSARELFAHIAI